MNNFKVGDVLYLKSDNSRCVVCCENPFKVMFEKSTLCDWIPKECFSTEKFNEKISYEIELKDLVSEGLSNILNKVNRDVLIQSIKESETEDNFSFSEKPNGDMSVTIKTQESVEKLSDITATLSEVKSNQKTIIVVRVDNNVTNERLNEISEMAKFISNSDVIVFRDAPDFELQFMDIYL